MAEYVKTKMNKEQQQELINAIADFIQQSCEARGLDIYEGLTATLIAYDVALYKRPEEGPYGMLVGNMKLASVDLQTAVAKAAMAVIIAGDPDARKGFIDAIQRMMAEIKGEKEFEADLEALKKQWFAGVEDSEEPGDTKH